jgi:fibronectin type 3 domain-containing protein
MPTSAGSATGTLTVNSNSLSGSKATVALSGAGAAVAYSVDLNWSAPSSTGDTVAGYHIYRALSGGSYALLNSSLDLQTSYVDSTVAAGSTYQYEVKSVDESGVESVASNTFAVTIP